MSDIKERDVEAYLVRRVKEAGGGIRKVRWLGRDGAPDRRILGKCWVEVKAPNGRLSVRQIREIESMKAAKELVEVVYNFEDVDKVVRRYFPCSRKKI